MSFYVTGQECKGHDVQNLVTDSSELSVLCVGDLPDITPIRDEIEESEMQSMEGEFEVSDANETVKPQWMKGIVNLLCLQPVPGPDLV
jgi:hypothetical protein